ncbi:hypothetical protein ACFJGX_05130 [Hydrogenophaga sp. UC242_50]|uniref:hypothetical protein n=1 Tax=unclassified Hydrogenophaga TaxID=2610897 RepID=UPI0036D42413
MTSRTSSAADFLLAPEVQQILKTVFANPTQPHSRSALAKATRLTPDDVERTQQHLLQSGILIQHPAEADGEAGPVSANTGFVFYAELRRIALKSFAAAEPLRAMLRTKFKDSVLQAVLLGEDAEGTLNLLIVHGERLPDAAAMAAACQKLRGTLGRHLQVHVLSHASFEAHAARTQLARRLASGEAMQILAPGETKAQAPSGRGGLLQAAKARLTAFRL